MSLRFCLTTGMVAATMLAVTTARAQSAPELKVNWAFDGSITGAAVLGTALASLIPVDQTSRWRTHLLPFDRRLEGRTSASVAKTSDIIAALAESGPQKTIHRRGRKHSSKVRMA